MNVNYDRDPTKKEEPKPEVKNHWPTVVFLLGVFLIVAAFCIAWKVTP